MHKSSPGKELQKRMMVAETGDRPSILVVDDEAVIREGMRRILEADGYAVETSVSGYVAIEAIQLTDSAGPW